MLQSAFDIDADLPHFASFASEFPSNFLNLIFIAFAARLCARIHNKQLMKVKFL